MIKKTIMAIVLVATFCSAEVSVFNSDNSSNNNLLNLQQKIIELESKVTSQQNDINGLRSVINGLNAEVAYLKSQISDIKITNTNSSYKKKEVRAVKKEKSTDIFKGLNLKQIEKKANLLFKQKKYDNAIKFFTYLENKKHNLAENEFMLGECYFNKKMYAHAIKYYKNSINNKKKYTPRILSHTAISLERIGDKKTAQKFYTVLKNEFPSSIEAKKIKNN